MAFTWGDWNEITERIRSIIAQQGTNFVQGRVLKADPVRNLVWLEETGDQPVPLIAFDYKDEETGAKVKVVCPKKGDLVLVAFHLGTRRLPKCLGKVQSTGWLD